MNGWGVMVASEDLQCRWTTNTDNLLPTAIFSMIIKNITSKKTYAVQSQDWFCRQRRDHNEGYEWQERNVVKI